MKRPASNSIVFLTVGALFLTGTIVYRARVGNDGDRSLPETEGAVSDGTTAGGETTADSVLRAMSAYLAGLKQFSVMTDRRVQAVLPSGQKISFTSAGPLYVSRPNRLRVDSRGDPNDPRWVVPDSSRRPRNLSIYYDGLKLTVFARTKNEYVSVKAPPTLDEALTFAWDSLNIEAPAADLIHENSYEILMDGVTSSRYVGLARVNAVVCHQLLFRKENVDFQIWVDTGAVPLPRMFQIASPTEQGNPDFTIALTNWHAGSVADSLFVFTPPAGARETEFAHTTARRNNK